MIAPETGTHTLQLVNVDSKSYDTSINCVSSSKTVSDTVDNADQTYEKMFVANGGMYDLQSNSHQHTTQYENEESMLDLSLVDMTNNIIETEDKQQEMQIDHLNDILASKLQETATKPCVENIMIANLSQHKLPVEINHTEEISLQTATENCEAISAIAQFKTMTKADVHCSSMSNTASNTCLPRHLFESLRIFFAENSVRL
jgi:hypothetical protein